MLAADGRSALYHCRNHRIAICPHCGEPVTFERIGAFFCPRCRADLTAVLQKHLVQQSFQQARDTAKESRQIRDEADVAKREAEAERDNSRRMKRGRPPDSAA